MTAMITEAQIRMAQARVYEDIQPDPVMSRWKFGLVWYGAFALGIATLSGGLMMAWRALQ